MSNNEERIKRSPGVHKEGRAMQDRAVTDSREMTDAERLQQFRMSMFRDKLPDLPKIPGYHVIWLSTTHSSDTIPQRRRMGYEPIKGDEIPGWDLAATITNGEHAGFIGVNEMLAFKIPLSLYNEMMAISHHEMPLEEEDKLNANLEMIKEGARAHKGQVLGEAGYDSLGKRVRRPDFASEEAEY